MQFEIFRKFDSYCSIIQQALRLQLTTLPTFGGDLVLPGPGVGEQVHLYGHLPYRVLQGGLVLWGLGADERFDEGVSRLCVQR